jgi:hypothetical protein
MLYVGSFFLRRLLIGQATANINRILLSVVTEMDQNRPVDEAIRACLSTGRKCYASDDEIRAGAATSPTTSTVARISGRSCCPPADATPAWNAVLEDDLGPDENLDDVYESIVHTLGNLTLTFCTGGEGPPTHPRHHGLRPVWHGRSVRRGRRARAQSRVIRPLASARACSLLLARLHPPGGRVVRGAAGRMTERRTPG